MPVWVGNAILLIGAAVGARGGDRRPVRVVGDARGVPVDRGRGHLDGDAALSHALVVGYMVSIRFTDYFVGGPPPPRPGLKSDYSTYLKADPGSRAWMHAFGAIVSKLAPFLALAFWPGSGAPWWSAAALIAIGVITIVTDLTLSVRKSDWKKFKRERAIAKGRASII